MISLPKKRKEIIDKIFAISKLPNAFEVLEQDFSKISREDLRQM